MLRKLMKYELLATARLMLPLYLVVLLLSVGARFSGNWLTRSTLPDKAFLDLLSLLFFLGFWIALIAAFVVALVLMILRFRSNLLGDEGYVMFTLPVSPHQLVWSKLLVSTLWFAGAALVDGLALLIVTVSRPVLTDLQTLFSEVWRQLGTGNAVLLAAEILLLCVVYCLTLCLAFYTPLSIGHSFDRHKMLLSVVFFFAFELATQLLGGLLLVIDTPALHFLDVPSPDLIYHGALWLGILLNLVYGAVLYVLNHWMLCKRLNLE